MSLSLFDYIVTCYSKEINNRTFLFSHMFNRITLSPEQPLIFGGGSCSVPTTKVKH